MSNQSFKVKNGLTLTPVDLTTLTSPQAGDLACDVNDSNKIKRYDASLAVWSEVGSGGVGNIDALLTQTFDNAALSQFTQTGMELVSSNTINGTQSARLIHQAASSRSFKQIISVDRKYRSELMQLSLQVRSSAASGNLTLLITDETNSATIAASQAISTSSQIIASLVTNSTTTVSGFSNSIINSLAVGMTVTGSGIPTGTVINAIDSLALTITLSQAATASATVSLSFSGLPNRNSFSFTIPANCASISYTITALQESNSPESYIDDIVIQLAQTALLETSVSVPNLTAWQGYTPTFQGFGTPTNTEFEWRQVGESVEIRGKFTSGTATSVEARVGLPGGLTSAGTGLIPSLQIVGVAGRSANAAQSIYNVNIEPSVSYVTFGFQGASNSAVSKVNATVLVGSGESLSFFASVPCAGLSATSTKTIPLTQSGLVQNADSTVSVGTANGFGSTATNIRRYSTLITNIGSDISYQDSATNGASFTINTSGIYEISVSENLSASGRAAITRNQSALNVGVGSLSNSVALRAFQTLAAGTCSGSWQGYLVAGDIIRVNTDAVSSGSDSGLSGITIAKQSSLKQVSVNSNSKITIPTSELRFEGASTRGSTATAIVKFDTLAKIRGDAFTVTNTAADGTFVTMLKAGKLDIGVTLYGTATGRSVSLSKNQAVLTANPVAAEILAGEYTTGTGDVLSASWSGFVAIGDILRVCSNQAVVSDATNSFNLSFQEQDIAVSVTNTLPQFSESDTSLRLSGANGYGSTATTTRRFASILQNIGSDVQYVDSPTLGGQFIAQSAGIYNISYSEVSTSNTTNIYNIIAIDGTTVAITGDTVNTANANGRVGSASWTGYLTQGQIITAKVDTAANNNGNQVYFTISKVGKPNVTGVNVTPFVNVPQPQNHVLNLTNGSLAAAGRITNYTVSRDSSSGVISYNSGVITALKTCSITIAAQFRTTTNVRQFYIRKNSTLVVSSTLPSLSYDSAIPYTDILSPGDTIDFITDANGVNNCSSYIVATALSDQILTAPETFSTDTAALTYANAATYTLSTLSNAPVGTYITFTYAINTNTRTQTTLTNRPSQTDADMNANGMLIYTRAYNAASTAAQPATIAIQIGKGLKGKSLDLYKSAGKVTAGSLDSFNESSTVRSGALFKEYNEVTGVLIIDAGYNFLTSFTSSLFYYSDTSTQTSGYLVINASKNPALTGLGLNRVAARAVQSSGQSIAASSNVTLTWDAIKTFDTNGALNTSTGIYTVAEDGYYEILGQIAYASTSWGANLSALLYIYINGSVYATGGDQTSGGTVSTVLRRSIATNAFLKKGDQITLVAFHNSTVKTLATAQDSNYFSITKVSV